MDGGSDHVQGRSSLNPPRSAELAASLQSLQHVVGGLLSTLKDNGVAAFEESFASCYPASWKNSWTRQVGFTTNIWLQTLAEGPSCPFGRKWRDGKKGQGGRKLAGQNTTKLGIQPPSLSTRNQQHASYPALTKCSYLSDSLLPVYEPISLYGVAAIVST